MMKYVFALTSIALSVNIQAATSFYCPQHASYINVGMTSAQVLQACGEPASRQTGDNAITKQIPVTQLIYTTLNQGPVDYEQGLSPIYQMWNMPSGSTGVNLQVNIIDGRVAGITLNQQQTNGLSTCANGSFQIGDPIANVYQACGAPGLVNNTYINQAVPSNQKPQIWGYQFPYQPSISLTFVGGILQSID
jgi:hypothetical protein